MKLYIILFTILSGISVLKASELSEVKKTAKNSQLLSLLHESESESINAVKELNKIVLCLQLTLNGMQAAGEKDFLWFIDQLIANYRIRIKNQLKLIEDYKDSIAPNKYKKTNDSINNQLINLEKNLKAARINYIIELLKNFTKQINVNFIQRRTESEDSYYERVKQANEQLNQKLQILLRKLKQLFIKKYSNKSNGNSINLDENILSIESIPHTNIFEDEKKSIKILTDLWSSIFQKIYEIQFYPLKNKILNTFENHPERIYKLLLEINKLNDFMNLLYLGFQNLELTKFDQENNEKIESIFLDAKIDIDELSLTESKTLKFIKNSISNIHDLVDNSLFLNAYSILQNLYPFIDKKTYTQELEAIVEKNIQSLIQLINDEKDSITLDSLKSLINSKLLADRNALTSELLKIIIKEPLTEKIKNLVIDLRQALYIYWLKAYGELVKRPLLEIEKKLTSIPTQRSRDAIISIENNIEELSNFIATISSLNLVIGDNTELLQIQGLDEQKEKAAQLWKKLNKLTEAK